MYFVADESYSMLHNVAALNAGLRSLLDALQAESMAAAKVRFCVIGFSDTAFTHLEPTDLRQIEYMPELTAQNGTSFAAAFDTLTDRIHQDIAILKTDGYEVIRPSVFFLTDGVPNPGDPWESAHQRLTSSAKRPNILAFGIGQADVNVIRRIATHPEYAYMSVAGTDTGLAVTTFITSLTQSVINSGQALASGQGALQIEKPANFISLAVDSV